jgi:hypothetical protein
LSASPRTPRGALAAVILVVAAESAISPVRALQASRKGSNAQVSTLVRLLTAFVLTALLAVAGITLAAGTGGGLFWLPAAFLVSVFVAAVNAWILLVEIRR